MNKEKVQQIANLARIKFSDEELEVLTKELSSIFSYIDQLKEVDIKDIEPFVHAVDLKNVTRKDEVRSCDINLVELAPESKNNFIKTKPIFNEQH
jgi:aspartyl-tRNA(Asn)/glutamyl-tRNA(Gln) amidotransferase subunit C